jgi:hypothetical protein
MLATKKQEGSAQPKWAEPIVARVMRSQRFAPLKAENRLSREEDPNWKQQKHLQKKKASTKKPPNKEALMGQARLVPSACGTPYSARSRQ